MSTTWIKQVFFRTDCLLDIEKGIRTLSLITPEIAFLAAGLVSDNVVVIGEVIAGNMILKKPKKIFGI